KGGVLEPGVLRPTTTELRLTDMDRDGIDATVMYGPIVPWLIQDPDLREVCYRAYNDWLVEFCGTAPDRLVGAGLIPIDDAETGIGWLPYMLERMDDTYQKFLDAEEFWRRHGGLQLTMAPSAYFRRQVWATFQTDHLGLRVVDLLGDDRVMWASDYPHADSTWPESQRAI